MLLLLLNTAPILGWFLQENLYDDSMVDAMMTENRYDKDYCQELGKRLMHLNSLPKGCLQYKDVANDLKRRDTDTTHASSMLG
jgi:hypothetical protein